jgi:starch synthase
MKIALLASEVVPFAKTGGLADVAGALPKFLSSLGLELRVFLPLYRETKKRNLPLRRVIESLELDWNGEKVSFSVWESRVGTLGFLMIERDEYFDRDFLYGTPQGDYPDNGERFAFFSDI